MVLALISAILLSRLLVEVVFTSNSPAFYSQNIITKLQTSFTNSFQLPFLSFSVPLYRETSSPPVPQPTYSFSVIPNNQARPTNNPTLTPSTNIQHPTQVITTKPTTAPTYVPTKTPTQPPSGTTLCGQSPTSIPSWGDDAPYYEACVYDTDMKPVAMEKLCRAVCKSDNCTESICVANGSYVKVNRGGHHSGYTDYGIKISTKDAAGKTRTIVDVRPVNQAGRLHSCVTIEGMCYTWDFITSSARSVSIIVSK